MVEAVRTTASTAGTWVIVIVAVVLLAFWLTSIMLADRSQVRASGRAPLARGIGPGGAWADAGIADEQTAEIPGEAVHEPVERRGRLAGDEQADEPAPRGAGEPVPQGEVPTRDDLPAQPAAAGPHSMPRQRTGDADRAEPTYTGRGYAGPGAQGDEEQGR